MHLHEFKKVALSQLGAELLKTLSERVVIADGAMGTMLQDRQPTLEDYQNHEGCNEILNITRPDIVLGVCGEHGGDPASIHFFESISLDYVSCSPFRVPVARLEAGRANIHAEGASTA